MELLTEEFAGKLLRRQKEFFSKGETLSYRYRMEQLQKLKSTVLAYERELETALAADLGKSRLESYSTEIGFVLSGITHAMKHLKKWMKPVKVRSPLTVFSAKSRIERRPYGSALIIGPYNYPFQLLIEPLTAALAAGNCAVLSPSELAPRTAETVRKLIGETFAEEYV